MLHGPWKEANAPIVTLHIDDNNVNGEAIAMALAYLYGHHPKLNDNNAFRVLAAASFLDLQVNVFLVGSYDGRCSFLSYSKLLCSSMNIFFPFLWHYFFLCAFWFTSGSSSMQDLCAICTDFIISELWTSNFLSYQV